MPETKEVDASVITADTSENNVDKKCSPDLDAKKLDEKVDAAPQEDQKEVPKVDEEKPSEKPAEATADKAAEAESKKRPIDQITNVEGSEAKKDEEGSKRLKVADEKDQKAEAEKPAEAKADAKEDAPAKVDAPVEATKEDEKAKASEDSKK